MISAVAWVPKGAAKAEPVRAQPSPEDLDEQLEPGLEVDGAEDDSDSNADNYDGADSMSEDDAVDSDEEQDGDEAAVAKARAVAASLSSGKRTGGSKGTTNTGDIEAALRELDMDNYDKEDDGDPAIMQRALNTKSEVFTGEDTYLQLGSDDESEQEDLRLKPTDLVLLAARNEDDVSNLEVWVYEEAEELGGEANVYVHHEILLSTFPLCIAWTDCNPRAAPSEKGNLVAVGTLEPGIEIWDLDVLDAVEPVAVLGGEDKNAAAAQLLAAEAEEGGMLDKKKKKKLKAKQKKAGKAYLPGSHHGGVLGLSWNSTFRNVLASGGEDCVVKVWDIAAGQPAHDLTHHTDKVQAVAWNPVEPQVLLTGAFDRRAALVDVRTAGNSPAMWSLPADVEALSWCPHEPTMFLVSCENGMVLAYDARNGAGSAPLWQLAAHDRPTCALSWCSGPAAQGLLATGSTDKVAKLWDVSSGRPSLVDSQDLQVGAVFTLGFCADAPHLLAVGGAAGSVSVWDIRASSKVTQRFPGLIPQNQAQGQDQG